MDSSVCWPEVLTGGHGEKPPCGVKSPSMKFGMHGTQFQKVLVTLKFSNSYLLKQSSGIAIAVGFLSPGVPPVLSSNVNRGGELYTDFLPLPPPPRSFLGSGLSGLQGLN